jgi:hypothetical protein
MQSSKLTTKVFVLGIFQLENMPDVLIQNFSILYYDDSHITNENDNPELAHLNYVHSIISHRIIFWGDSLDITKVFHMQRKSLEQWILLKGGCI